MKAFRRFNFLNLAYTLLVIVWGAYVRATGSGAGCGDHWPLCNGQVLPQTESLKTLIEFTHRTSSGVSLILVLVGFFWARAISKKGAVIRWAAGLTVLAIFLEAALGAGLVLLKLVAFDQSVLRAVSISLHLVNTLFLLASLATLLWLSGDQKSYAPVATKVKVFCRDSFFWGTLGVFIVLGVSGAVTALGDTLFPSTSLSGGLAQDLSHHSHFLVRLRVIHPILATTWVVLAFLWSRKLEWNADARWSAERGQSLSRERSWLLSLVTLQFLLGFMNWVLMAPNGLQLIHLLVADGVFLAFWWSGLKYEARESRI